MAADVRIATAGWAIPRQTAYAFAAEGSGLERYATRFDAAEINSTFYRSHRVSTWLRWRDSTPPNFRFAVKAPKAVTHIARLTDCDALVRPFLAEVALLGEKLGPVLVQLPPSLAFEAAVAGAFFGAVRRDFAGSLACEPRHASWFTAEADRLLSEMDVARVAADPARHPRAADPGGATSLLYLRLHGSPQMYRSSYDAPAISALAKQLAQSAAEEAWCVFDNTTSGAVAASALELSGLLEGSSRAARPRRRGTASRCED